MTNQNNNAETNAADSYDWEATYCLDDNKLRLTYCGLGRFSDNDREAIKSAGYRWASKQECYVCPSWSCAAEDMALEMAGYISDESYGPEERAADRAERFSDYRDKRKSEALGHADTFEAGPSVHGHQSQAKAERAARLHNRQRIKAVSQWNKAEYWQDRTAGVIANALYKARPDVRRRRILKLEKQQRKYLLQIKSSQSRFDGWIRVLDLAGSDKPEPAESLQMAPQIVVDSKRCGTVVFDCSLSDDPHRIAYTLANLGYGSYDYKHPRTDEKSSLYSLMTGADPISPKEAAELWLDGSTVRPGDEGTNAARVINHLNNRLAFENSMLENEGGKVSEVDIVPGGFVNVGVARSWRAREIEADAGGWAQILKVNKSPKTKRVVSVSVAGCKKRNGNRTFINLNIESAGADSYRSPTAEQLKAFNSASLAEKRKAKAAAKENPKPKLINPTIKDAVKLQKLINAHERNEDKHREVIEFTQAEYSRQSKGAYANAGTEQITEFFEVYRPSFYGGSNHPGRTVIFKIRMMRGRVIVLSDKPKKPVSFDLADAVLAGKMTEAETVERLPEIVAARDRLKAESKAAGRHGMADRSGLTEAEQNLFSLARYWGFASSSTCYDWGLNKRGKQAIYGPRTNYAIENAPTGFGFGNLKEAGFDWLAGCIWAELIIRDYENDGFKLTEAGRLAVETVEQIAPPADSKAEPETAVDLLFEPEPAAGFLFAI